MKYFIYIILGLSILYGLFGSFDESRNVTLSFDTKYVNDSNIELGEKYVKQEGKFGSAKETWRSIGILSEKKKVSSTTLKYPTDKTISIGTKRHQYMWCSDGTYHYYTNEQFANNTVGFTPKSPDICAQNGNGYKTRLAASAPTPSTSRFRSGAICRDGTYSSATGRGACSWHGGVSHWL